MFSFLKRDKLPEEFITRLKYLCTTTRINREIIDFRIPIYFVGEEIRIKRIEWHSKPSEYRLYINDMRIPYEVMSRKLCEKIFNLIEKKYNEQKKCSANTKIYEQIEVLKQNKHIISRWGIELDY